MIICAAGDPGGSRAVMQVILQMEKERLAYIVLDHGYLGKELPKELRQYLRPWEIVSKGLREAGTFLFGSSVRDSVPLKLARQAQRSGVPVAHILDNWSAYMSRLCTDGQKPLIPDVYAVPDEIAREAAAAEGVPSHCLVVTGHPCMGRPEPLRGISKKDSIIQIAFISEPFSMIFGHDLKAPRHPGFTEQSVFAQFCDCLRPFGDTMFMYILPHPKQNAASVKDLWEDCAHGLKGRVCEAGMGSAMLGKVDGVAGMASILLYEAWLSGMPCLCMQPGSQALDLRRFALLDDIFYSDAINTMDKTVERWFARCSARMEFIPRPEAELHRRSAEKITSVLKMLERRVRPREGSNKAEGPKQAGDQPAVHAHISRRGIYEIGHTRGDPVALRAIPRQYYHWA